MEKSAEMKIIRKGKRRGKKQDMTYKFQKTKW